MTVFGDAADEAPGVLGRSALLYGRDVELPEDA